GSAPRAPIAPPDRALAGDGVVVRLPLRPTRTPRARDETVELSYGVAPAARGRGVAARAVRLVSRWCLEDAGFRRVELHIAPANTASRRVAESAGFVHAGWVRSYVAATGASFDDLLYVLEREPTR